MTIDLEKYAPLVLDLVYFKNDEGTLSSNDINVLGINAGYTWDVYNAETEAYYWVRFDNNDGNPLTGDSDTTHTVGTRGSFMPTEEWIFGGEAALQFGTVLEDLVADDGTIRSLTTGGGDNVAAHRDRMACMLDLFVEYLGWQQYMYSPKLGAEYIFTSGDDRDPGDLGDTETSWDPMYRGYFPTMIRPYIGKYYMTSRFQNGEDRAFTNQHEVLFTASMQPLDDISTKFTLAKYFFSAIPLVLGQNGDEGTSPSSHDAGTELNIVTTYDYTEDVTFSLASAWYWPGDAYDHTNNSTNPTGRDIQPETATEVVGSMKVSF